MHTSHNLLRRARMRLLGLAALAALAAPPGQAAEPRLQAITLHASGTPAGDAGTGVTLLGLPELERTLLRERLALALGRPLQPALVEALVTEVNRQLQLAGQAFAVASVPDQDVAAGRLRIEVTRGRLQRLAVDGAADAAAIEQQFDALRAAPVLDADALQDTLAWLDRAQPGRRSVARYSPGDAPGAVAMALQVQEPARLGFSAGADNTGSAVTGETRLSAGLALRRLLGHQDQVQLRLSADPDFRHARSWQLGYQLGLPWRHLLSVNASGGRIRGRMPEPLALSGGSSGVSLRYEIPLRLSGTWTDSLQLGLDRKRSDNNLLFSETPVTQTLTTIGQWVLGYSAQRPDAWGSTQLQAQLIVSPGGMFAHGDDAAFDATRPGARARYRIWQLQLERSTPLGSSTWLAQLALQQANANLLGSEQLSGGGVASVRGFREGAAFGDSGWTWRNELRLPALAAPGGWALTPLLLADAAALRVHAPQPGEPARRYLGSAGLGLVVSGPQQLSLQLQWARRIKSGLSAQAQGGDRLHLSLQWSGG
ncbi:hypothetical protein NYO99_11085 [Pelomonas sp. UHG3]|uniref:Uncharacterized protein n=1 Tax=Roseateles hydrophilus TaxID=2975054 RepID=A0ACC6CAR9_9BURK|nr:ShlB/FhaC/HecB family hemolysin secretion/activation protein [Pelomonas sp. UHG3]MCY4745516.1 hypothetical protein [Pelomonas sp. UHG3]